jgi:hypothetical protein
MRGVDYIAKLPGIKNPMGWYKQYPRVAGAWDEQAEQRSQINLMIALDNWWWRPVRQASRLSERHDQEDLECAKLLVQTQFRKRLILLNMIEAYKVIPREAEDELFEDLHAGGNTVLDQKKISKEEERDSAILEHQAEGRAGELRSTAARPWPEGS